MNITGETGDDHSAPPSSSNGKEVQTGGKSPTVVDVINVFCDRVGPVLEYIKTLFEQYTRREQLLARGRFKMTWVAFFIVALIVIVAGVLTYVDKIDGSTFTFLLGLVVGYTLTFVREAINPPRESQSL